MRLGKWLLLIVTMSIISTGFAASRVYQIEVLVFAHPTTKTLLAENWAAHVVMPNVENAIQLKPFDGATPKALFQLLPDAQFRLISSAKLAQLREQYQVLTQMAWSQTMATPKQAPWIHISGGSAVQVDGILRISRPSLFQIDANVVLTIPRATLQQIAPTAADKITATQFLLKQTVSLRANQLYYLDHPLFGVLIKIIPTDEKTNEDQ